MDKYLNKEGLTTYNKGIKSKFNELKNSDIKEFKAATPFSDGLIVWNAVTNNNMNIQSMDVYNGLDAKYPNAAAGTQAVKSINDRVKTLESKTTNIVSSIDVKKIVVVTQYPTTLEEDTLYLLVSD